jgi:peptidoglycan/LPS O-acetylase OafA/YrhL
VREEPVAGEVGELPPLGARPDVQGLRAVAVAVVILGHGHLHGFSGGFVGVDVFFVVSGFVISSLLLHEATTTGRVRVGGFYARRARRILPAAGVVLVVTSVFAALELPATRVSALADDVRWSAAFLANVHFSQLGTDYFQQDRATSPVQHMWSLAVEEQFYLVWPLLLLLLVTSVRRRRLLACRVLVGGAWLASFAWSAVQTTRSPVTSYFSSTTRAWELATGALLALYGRHLPLIPRWVRHLLTGAGLAAVVVAVASYDETTPFPGTAAALPVLGTAAVLAAGAGGVIGGGRILALPPVRYVGDISYSLYLWHWPVLVLGGYELGHEPGPRDLPVLLALVVAASVLSYHVVENPIRHERLPGLRDLRSLALWPVVLALVLVVSAWSSAYAARRFEARAGAGSHVGRLAPDLQVHRAAGGHGRAHRRAPALHLPDPDVQALIDASLRAADRHRQIPFPLVNLEHLTDDVWQRTFDCYAGFEEDHHRICSRGDRTSSRVVVLYGDSHAGMWLPALDLLGQRDGFRVVPLVKLGCAPFDVHQVHRGAPLSSCPLFHQWALRQMAGLRPAVVVVAYRGLLEVVPDPGESEDEAWSAGAARSLRALERVADRVEVVSDISFLDYSPGDCLTDPHSTMASCTQHEQALTERGNELTRAAARTTGARWVDVGDLVCRHRRCPLVVRGVVTYRDASHLSTTWGRIIADSFGRRLGIG